VFASKFRGNCQQVAFLGTHIRGRAFARQVSAKFVWSLPPNQFVGASRVGGAWAIQHAFVVRGDGILAQTHRERVIADRTATIARRVLRIFAGATYSIFEASLGRDSRVTDVIVAVASLFQESFARAHDGCILHALSWV